MKKIYVLLLSLIMYSAFGQEGSLDLTFTANTGSGFEIMIDPDDNLYIPSSTGQLGKISPSGVVTNLGPVLDFMGVSCRLSDGSILINNGSVIGGTSASAIIKISATGVVDPSFATNLPPGFYTHKIIQLPDGRILVGGEIGINTTIDRLYCLNQNTGNFDTSFNNGQSRILYGQVYDIKTDSNGNIFVAGSFGSYSGSARKCIAKLNPDGTLNNFNFQGFNNGAILTIGIKDNQILIGGNFIHVPTGRKNLLRINADGTLDTGFNPSIDETLYSAINKIMVQSTGKIIILGSFQSIEGITRKNVARLNTNGSLDLCFVPGAGGSPGNAENGILDSHDNIFVTGYFDSYDGYPRNYLAKLKGKGAAIVTQPDSGTVTSGTTTTMAIANVLANDTYNGVIATTSDVAVTLTSFTPAAANGGFTLNSNGKVEVLPNTTPGIYTLTYKVCPIGSTCNCQDGTATVTVTSVPLPVIDAINDIVSIPFGTTTTYHPFVNDTYNGVVGGVSLANVNFGSGTLPGSPVYCDANGNIIVDAAAQIGIEYSITYVITDKFNPGNADSASIKVTITSPPITPGIRANNIVTHSGMQLEGKIIIGGYFSQYNGMAAPKIAKLNSDLTLDTTFSSTGPIPSNERPLDLKVLSNGSIIVVGNFTGFNGVTTGKGIAKLKYDGTLDTTFNVGGTGASGYNSIIYTVNALSISKTVIGGAFDNYNGTVRKGIARLNMNGSVDTAFDPGVGFATNGAPVSIALQTDGKIIAAGTFVSYQGVSANGIVRINSSGLLDTSFTSGLGIIGAAPSDLWARKLILQPDGKIILFGSFTQYNTTARKNIARLNNDGTLDTTFNPGTSFNGAVRSVAIEPDGKMIVGGDFTTYNGVSVNKLVRLSATGILDTSFNTGTGPSGNVWTLTRQPFDGKVIVGGQFTTYNGISATNITRIAPGIPGSQERVITIWQSEPEIDINPIMSKGSVAIYPNPSEGIFNIDFKGYDEQKFDIIIHNAVGQLIYQGTVTPQDTNQIDLTRFEAGSYFITLQNSFETINKIVVKK